MGETIALSDGDLPKLLVIETYPELLLPLWGHEALLGLLGLGGLLHALTHLSALALNLSLLRLLSLIAGRITIK